MLNHYLPEPMYNVTNLGDWENNPFSCIGQIVHVYPQDYTQSERLNCEGSNFHGYIPKGELSIYEVDYFTDNFRIPRFLPALTKGNRITAKIIDYDSESKLFILSRKQTMEEALQSFYVGQIVMAYKTSGTKNSLFIDIGAGINAIIPSQEISNCAVEHANKYFTGIISFPVKIIYESPHYKDKFVASYKAVAPQLEIDIGDRVTGKVTGIMEDNTAVFVELSPTQIGILDLDNISFSTSNDGSDIVLNQCYDFIVRRIRLSHDTKIITKKNMYSLSLA